MPTAPRGPARSGCRPRFAPPKRSLLLMRSADGSSAMVVIRRRRIRRSSGCPRRHSASSFRNAARKSRSARACCFSTVLTAMPRFAQSPCGTGVRLCAARGQCGSPQEGPRSQPQAAPTPAGPSPRVQLPGAAAVNSMIFAPSPACTGNLPAPDLVERKPLAVVNRKASGHSTYWSSIAS